MWKLRKSVLGHRTVFVCLLCGMVVLSPPNGGIVDKQQYDDMRMLLRPFFRAGVSRENAIEALRAAYLDYEEEQKEATLTEGA